MEVTDDWIQRCERRERYMLNADPSSQREVSNTAIYSMGWLRFNVPKCIRVDLWTSQGLTTVT